MFNLKKLFFFLSLSLVIHPFLFAEEQLTITTYYPSPAGSYFNLYVKNSLGIGTTVPAAFLDVVGAPAIGLGNASAIFRNNQGSGAASAVRAWTVNAGAAAGVYGDLAGYDGSLWFGVRGNSGVAGAPAVIGVNTVANGVAGYFSGNVGIGTTAPGDTLAVQSANTNDTGIYLTNTSTGGRSWLFESTGQTHGLGAGKFLLYDLTAGSLVRLAIDTSGNVGIGTTAPGAKLDVLAGSGIDWAAQFQGNKSSGGYINLYDAVNSATRGFLGYGPTLFTSAPDNTWFGLRTQGTLAFGRAGTINMVIDTSGNLGIGTTAPATKLEVSGTIYSSHAESNTLDLSTWASNNANYFLLGPSGYWGMRQGTAHDFNFDVWNSGSQKTALTILQSGLVGIGTTNPSFPLSVVSSGAYPASFTSNLSGSGPYVQLISTGSGAHTYEMGINMSGGDGKFIIYDVSAGAGRITVDTAGYVGIGTASPTDRLTVAGNEIPSTDAVFTSGKSGQRWSAVWASNGTIQTCFLAYKNITSWKPFSDYLYLVPKPVQYTWKSGDNREHLGYIGDDLPQIAKVDKDGIEEKAVIAILCGAVRQLEEKVKSLEVEISGLKGKSK